MIIIIMRMRMMLMLMLVKMNEKYQKYFHFKIRTVEAFVSLMYVAFGKA